MTGASAETGADQDVPLRPRHKPPNYRLWWLRAAAVVVVVLMGLAAWFWTQSREPQNGYNSNPYRGVSLFGNDPTTDAAVYLAAHPQATDLAEFIRVPKTHWISNRATTDGLAAWLDSVPRGSLAQTSFYRLPNRDCGGLSKAGGDALTEKQYDQVTSRIIAVGQPRIEAGQRVVVHMEPDSITAACYSAKRAALLKKEAARLSNAGFAVYLNGGNPNSGISLEETARRLIESGVAQTRGVFVGQAVPYPVAQNIAYGNALVKILDDTGLNMHFVVDSSRSGQGLPPDHSSQRWWCNNPALGLGERPHVVPGNSRLDAVVWIKNPDRSDGKCHPGDPIAGKFYLQYLRTLIRQANPPL